MPTDYKQTDPRWNTQPYAGENINNAGCAPTSDSDLLDIIPPTTAKWMQNNGYASDGYGTYWEGIPACLKAFGKNSAQLCYSSLLGVRSSGVFEKWKQHVQSGFCGILLMGNGGSPVRWTNGGHYIAVVDYKDGKYLVYDPASDARTGWHAWEDFIPSIKILYTSNVPTLSAPADYSYKFDMQWLHEGSVGLQVLLLQKAWRALGVYKAGYALDGKYESGTIEACKLWQNLHNLLQDGSAGYDTQRSLFRLRSMNNNGKYTFFCKPVIYGSQGESVILAQSILKADGYYKGAIDGDAGTLTKEAVTMYQRVKRASGEYKGSIDGKVESLTWKCLIGF